MTRARDVANLQSGAIINEAGADLDFRIESDGNANMLFVDGGNNNVGIGTNAPSTSDTLHVKQASGNTSVRIETEGTNGVAFARFLNDARNYSLGVDTDDSFFIYDSTGTKSRFKSTASETVINEDSGDINFRVETDNNVFGLFVDAGNDHVCINTGTDYGGVLNIETTGNGDTVTLACTDTDSGSGPILVLKRAVTGSSADFLGRIRFDGQDNAGNNTTYTRIDGKIIDATNGSEDGALLIHSLTGGSERERVRITQAETVLNEDGHDLDFRVESDANATMFHVDGGNNSIGVNTLGVSGSMFTIQGPAGTSGNNITTKALHIIEGGFNTGNTFQVSNSSSVSRFCVDGDGRVIVGKDSNSSSVAGTTLYGNGKIEGVRDGDVVHSFNRLSSDGTIVAFQKDGSTKGYISFRGAELQIGQGNAALQFSNGSDAIVPANESGTANDDAIDLGISSGRFDDIFATNGTIQTSDENEKQDIASMTIAELAVGKRLSTLFKTFRWKSKVTEKADKARTHSGIIAQEVKEAFKAEGLDATKYALFCSDTWWEKEISVDAVEADEEKGIEAKDAYTYIDIKYVKTEGYLEKTRLGVRYPELLSFIASYNESRFTAIEARLTALEGE